MIKNEMHVAKAFYFLFFGAFGSLFPLLAVYFKVGFPNIFQSGKVSSLTLQGLGMDAAQCGFLIGVRPIIEYLATPFWHGISDRCLLKSHCEIHKYKYKYTNAIQMQIHSFLVHSFIHSFIFCCCSDSKLGRC